MILHALEGCVALLMTVLALTDVFQSILVPGPTKGPFRIATRVCDLGLPLWGRLSRLVTSMLIEPPSAHPDLLTKKKAAQPRGERPKSREETPKKGMRPKARILRMLRCSISRVA